MDDEQELFIEEVRAFTVIFGGRSSSQNRTRQVVITRKEWDALGKPEGIAVRVRAR